MPPLEDIFDRDQGLIWDESADRWWDVDALSPDELWTIARLSEASDDVNDPLFGLAAAEGYAGPELPEEAGLEALAEAADEGDPEAAEALAKLEAEQSGWTPEGRVQLRASSEQLAGFLGRPPTTAETELVAEHLLATGSADAVAAYIGAVGSVPAADGDVLAGRELARPSDFTRLAAEVADDSYARSAGARLDEGEDLLAEAHEAADAGDDAGALAALDRAEVTARDFEQAAGALPHSPIPESDGTPGGEDRAHALEVANAAFGEYSQRDHPTPSAEALEGGV